jgi:alanine racemase
MSHLACSDDPGHALNDIQQSRFSQLIEFTKTKASLCASGGIFSFPHSRYDYVRPGLCLYGISPLANKTAEDLNLKPVMTFHSSLIAVNEAPAGSTVGYGGRYTCSKNTRIGVVSVGYGDGYPITAKDGTPVLVNNVRCPLIGRVSMDMITVDLSHCPQATIGDPVILWGQGLPLEEITSYTQSISYQIVTGVQHRVHFMWSQDSP